MRACAASLIASKGVPNFVVKILLAIFLPPVAAFLQVGLSLHFWLNIVLCLLGGLPGVIHAIWLVAAKKTA